MLIYKATVISSCDTQYTWAYYDGEGTRHAFPGISHQRSGTCGSSTSFSSYASDGSGYNLSVTGQLVSGFTPPDGAFGFAHLGGNGSTWGPVTDRNGNQIQAWRTDPKNG